MATMSGPASATRSRTASPSQRVKSAGGDDAGSFDSSTAKTANTSSRKTALNAVQPTRTTPHLQPLASILFLTMIVGTVASVYLTSADLTTFRSRIPASQLNRWEMGRGAQRAFPVPSLPYFADKRNIFNQLFVKQAWAWTTLLFVAHSASSYLFHPQPSTAQRISLKGPTPFSILFVMIRRYILATLYWYYLTQRSWFGVSFPSISKTILMRTGATCVPSAISSDQSGMPSFEGQPTGVCIGAAGEYWRGGHDVSGHTFMLVHSTLFLYQLIAPSLPLVFPKAFIRRGRNSGAASTATTTYEPQPVETPLPIKITVYLTLAFMAIWWWMLLMTSLFFHSPAEKLSGFLFALGGWYLSGL